MRNRTSEDTLCLMGGALLGAAAMYLLDPDAGERRRRRVAAAAENAYESARESVTEGWEKLADRTGDLTESASEYAQGLAGQARGIATGLAGTAGSYFGSGAKSAGKATGRAGKWGSNLMDRAQAAYERAREGVKGYGHSAADRASDVAEAAQEHGSGLRAFGQRMFGRAGDAGDEISSRATRVGKRAGKAGRSIRSVFTGEEEHEGVGAAGITSTALACCAVGAGLMYFLDPERGRGRRHWVTEKVGHFARSTGHTMRATGQDVANRVRGNAYKAARKARGMAGHQQPVSSEQLVSRIRSQMGHIVSNPTQVQLMADAQGTVTLLGFCPLNESEALITMIRAIPGVTDVINLAEAPGTSAPAPGGGPASQTQRRDRAASQS